MQTGRLGPRSTLNGSPFCLVSQRSLPAPGVEQHVKLEDVLPLAFTRLCEPKEASYSLIKKYVSQYYPTLKVDIR